MFENPRRGRQARNFTTNVPKILDLKSPSEQIFFRKLSSGAPDIFDHRFKLSIPCKHCVKVKLKLGSVRSELTPVLMHFR